MSDTPEADHADVSPEADPDNDSDNDPDNDADIAAGFDDEPIAASGQLQKWRRSTASGSILGAVALGLREVFENPREEAPIVMEAPGEPPGPRRIELDLDPDDPTASTVTYRPWMEGDETP